MADPGRTTFPRRTLTAGIPLHQGDLDQFDEGILALAVAEGTSRVCFANAHMTIEAHHRPDLREAMEMADLVCPDGMPLVHLLRRRWPAQPRVDGMSALPRLLSKAAERGVPVGFHGSTPEVHRLLADSLPRLYPGLIVAWACSPPFGPATEVDRLEQLQGLRASGARLVFVALGCPRQELWMARAEGLDACLLGVGNALAVLVGLERRAPPWARRASLEWAFRLAWDPRRLWRRYLWTNLEFFVRLPGWLRDQRRFSNSDPHA